MSDIRACNLIYMYCICMHTLTISFNVQLFHVHCQLDLVSRQCLLIAYGNKLRAAFILCVAHVVSSN